MAAELIDSAARHLLGSGEYGPASTGVVDGVQLGQRSEGAHVIFLGVRVLPSPVKSRCYGVR